MLAAELGVESLEAARRAKTAQQMANDETLPPLLGGDDLKDARAEGGQLGGRPKAAESVADDGIVSPVHPTNNLDYDVIKVKPRQGNQASYLVRRLKRDAANESAPNHARARDALSRLQSGESSPAPGRPRPPYCWPCPLPPRPI